MRREEFTEFTPTVIAFNHRACPICATRLILVGIEFQLSGIDLQTFKCARCGHVERHAVPV